MLVISRKQQEFVQIGDDIIIKIIKTSRGAVKIGIAAPEECRVLRGELSKEGLTVMEEDTDESDKVTLPRRFQKIGAMNLDAMKPVGTMA